jgi:hypothetical protein
MPVELVLLGVVDAVSQGGEGADRLEEDVESVLDDMVTVPPPSSTAASPALLLATWIVALVLDEALVPVRLPYHEFRREEPIVPMKKRRTPSPRAGTCARRV